MTNIQRARAVFESLMMLLGVAILLVVPDQGYRIIAAILSVVLIVTGIRYLIFYFSMARNMVDGKLPLFYGIIALDLGLFAYTLQDIPPIYIVLYLLITHLFSGVIDVLRALEARRMGSRWRLNMAIGAANVLLAFACGFCLHRLSLLTYVYAAGLTYSACLRMAQAFRRSAIIYIP